MNPLFSLQTGTNDNGDLAVKPFVNLHLTPNGCGVLGCDKASIDDLIPKGIVDAVKNPFGIFSDDGHHSHGLSSSYTAPGLSSSYGAPSSSYGVPDTSYQAPSTGYGPPPKPSYKTPSVGYGPPPKPSYDAPKPSYSQPKPSYNPPTSVYGPPPKPSYEAPKPTYDAPKPSYQAPATPSYNTPQPAQHHGHGEVQHVHHHYHHDSAFPREETEFENSFYYEEDNTVKRNTEGFVPIQPNFGGESSSGAGGFRFPRERGSRQLDFDANETVIEESNIEVQKEASDQDEVEEEEELEIVMPQRNGFKFVDNRKKRSADGVGHHHEEQGQYHRYEVPADTAADRAGHADPFGPTGFRPPTCGGPGSGYVCCSQPATSLDDVFAESINNNNINGIRDIRQQPEQFSQALNSVSAHTQFSQYGQCGRRNAHGITGRINNPAQRFAEGDTEFGEYPWQVALLKKEQYDNVYVCGGSLIDGSHLLTAAHCIKQYRPEELRVRLGEWDVNNDSEFFPNVEFDVLDMKVDDCINVNQLFTKYFL